MKINKMPACEYLNEALKYNPMTGEVKWRKRPPHHFKTLRAANTWNTKFKGKVAGSAERGYFRVSLSGRSYQLHRIIFKMVSENEPVAEIDHRDSNGRNNIWTNLREASQCENRANRSFGIFKGAVYHKSSGKYQAAIKFKGVRKYIGLFDTQKEASEAYRKEAKKMHGEFYNAG